ncbi:MAG: inositol monophosphatase, partial [Candidatus Latescibacterota bacterium]
REAKKIVTDAGNFIERNCGQVKKVEFKGKRNAVTWVDRESEKIIKNYLQRRFPGIPFLAEELNYRQEYTDLCWVVDPLDGTNNFSHGYPVFCVSCALVKAKESLLGIVYDPTRKELFWAQKGMGAFLNNRRIRVSRIRVLKKALVCTGFSYDFEDNEDTNIGHFINFLHASQGVRRAGAAALDLCYVACGRLDGFWELCLKPWDTAAGVLIVSEAGGKITKFDGSKFDIFYSEVVASNKVLHSKMIEILQRERRKIIYKEVK